MYFKTCGAISCSASHFCPYTFDIHEFSTSYHTDAALYFMFMDSMWMDSMQAIPPSLPTIQHENENIRVLLNTLLKNMN